MTNDNKSPMFGPSASFDPATHEPRSGKSALMNDLIAELAGKPEALATTVIGNCTTMLPMKFKFDPEDNGHTVIFAPTRSGVPRKRNSPPTTKERQRLRCIRPARPSRSRFGSTSLPATTCDCSACCI